ncbi:MAG TPA: hypothetical protein VGY99_32860 [Candidatus Binataceae bacterium]|nr:hypothetical protein [Candidatus Binataceae bacterium]
MTVSSSVVLIGLARLRRNSDWQNLDNWNWRERIDFVSHGVLSAIQVTEPAASVPIKLRLPPGWREIKESGAEPGYSLVVGNQVAPPGLDRLHLLFRGDALISAAYNLEPVLGALESELDRRVEERAAPERIFIRAGVVGWRGRAILIVGPPQSGTSTLVAALLRAGALYYSDHYAVLDSDGLVHPYARPLWLCTGSFANPLRHRPEELGARTGTQALAVGAVVFARYRPQTQPRFMPLARSAVNGELTASAVCAASYPQQTQASIGKALAGAWIFKGERGAAEGIVDLLLGTRQRGRLKPWAPRLQHQPQK